MLPQLPVVPCIDWSSLSLKKRVLVDGETGREVVGGDPGRSSFRLYSRRRGEWLFKEGRGKRYDMK